MKYGRIEGPIYCRYARTAPVLNSSLASEYGLEAEMELKPEFGFSVEQGRNVKLRLVLNKRSSRMTCHAKIDWVKEDPSTGECKVRFSHLSLSDDEFKVLFDNFTEQPLKDLVFGETVRKTPEEAIPVIKGQDQKEIVRDKALTLPVVLIEKIDEKRGDTPFSEFVVKILKDRLGD